MPRLLPLAVAVLALAGCGGDGRAEAVDTARGWLEAVGEGEADRACELMLDDAVAGLRAKLQLADAARCPAVVREYAKKLGARTADAVLEAGLEAEGGVKKDQVGVFPRSGPRELEVILMRRRGGEWKVASMSLGLTSTSR